MASRIPWFILATLSLVSAQSAVCTGGPKFQWAFNSLGQSPCVIAADLAGVCDPRGFNIPPLPPNDVYFGPPASSADPCRCNSVFYSLLSACAACQNRNFIGWTAFSTNCTQVYLTVFPRQIPAKTAVPHYAYLNVSTIDDFDVGTASAIGGPESTRTVPTSTGSPASSHTASSGSSKAGAIAGGVIGGVVFLAIVAGALLWFRKRNRPPSGPPSHQAGTGGLLSTPPPESARWNMSPQPLHPKIYNPSDPSTYPSMNGTRAAMTNPSLSSGPTLVTTHGVEAQRPQGLGIHYSGAPEV
ncbi:hypothetical protein AX17_004601 [Amanita inopinata Kibby_2008]|nr:hypothetical protein AX17_004601 [Amanita inopinata Kibby_2008]